MYSAPTAHSSKHHGQLLKTRSISAGNFQRTAELCLNWASQRDSKEKKKTFYEPLHTSNTIITQITVSILALRVGQGLERDNPQPSMTRATVIKTVGVDFIFFALTSNSHIYAVSQNAAA